MIGRGYSPAYYSIFSYVYYYIDIFIDIIGKHILYANNNRRIIMKLERFNAESKIISMMNTSELNKEIFIEWLNGTTQKALSEKYGECTSRIHARIRRAISAYNYYIIKMKREKERKEAIKKYEVLGDEAKYFLEYLELYGKLDLSTRSYNMLIRMGINDIRDLGKMTEKDFIRAGHPGKRSYEEIIETLMIPNGIHFKEA